MMTKDGPPTDGEVVVRSILEDVLVAAFDLMPPPPPRAVELNGETTAHQRHGHHPARRRPERKSKKSANTLVALSLADERITDLKLFRLNNEVKKTEPEKPPENSDKMPVRKKTLKKKKPKVQVGKKKARKKVVKKKKKGGKVTAHRSSKNAKSEGTIRNGEPPAKRPRKDLSTKTLSIIEHITNEDKAFYCLKCQRSFSTFNKLSEHRTKFHQTSAKLSSSLWTAKSEAWVQKRFNSVTSSLSDYISGSNRSVPETTFNNMHGTIDDLESTDGKNWRSNPAMGTVEKVKLNVSGPWTMRDVWETTGWEVKDGSLTWRRFGNDDKLIVQHLAQLPWPEQLRFKLCFDRYLNRRCDINKSTPKRTVDAPPRKTNLPQAVGLKQTGRSVKYMTSNERGDFIKKSRTEEMPNALGK